MNRCFGNEKKKKKNRKLAFVLVKNELGNLGVGSLFPKISTPIPGQVYRHLKGFQ